MYSLSGILLRERRRGEQESGVLTLVQVPVTSLSAQNQEPSHNDIGDDSGSARPPNHGVTDEVDLPVILDPEVLYTY